VDGDWVADGDRGPVLRVRLALLVALPLEALRN
jgi:hypothetical protein